MRCHAAAMGEPFVGSEAVAAGITTHSQLRRRYTRVFRDVYVLEGTELTPALRAHAAWLWSRRRGVIAGFRRQLCMAADGLTRLGPWTSSTTTDTRSRGCRSGVIGWPATRSTSSPVPRSRGQCVLPSISLVGIRRQLRSPPLMTSFARLS